MCPIGTGPVPGFLQLCDGDIINYSDVEEAIRQAREDYDLRMVGFDPYLSRTITQRLEPIVSVMEIPQDLRNMSPAMKEMDDLMTRAPAAARAQHVLPVDVWQCPVLCGRERERKAAEEQIRRPH